jgi:hypothetical protein
VVNGNFIEFRSSRLPSCPTLSGRAAEISELLNPRNRILQNILIPLGKQAEEHRVKPVGHREEDSPVNPPLCVLGALLLGILKPPERFGSGKSDEVEDPVNDRVGKFFHGRRLAIKRR